MSSPGLRPVPVAPSSSIEDVGTIALKHGTLVLGDIHTFDEEWKSSKGNLKTSGYAIDVTGTKAEYYAKLDHSHKKNAKILADDCWRITVENVQTAQILARNLRDHAKKTETDLNIEVNGIGSTRLLAKDAVRKSGVGIAYAGGTGSSAGPFAVVRSAAAKTAKVVAVRDADGVVTELRILL